MDTETGRKTAVESEMSTHGGKFVYVAVFSCNLISTAGGLIGSWASPVLPKLNNASRIDENPLGEILSSEQESWLGSLIALGAMFGPLPCDYLSNKIGRKKTILVIAASLVISAFALAFAESIYFYYVARFLTGIASTGIFVVVSVYICEISENHNRAILISSVNCFVAFGILLAYSVGPYVSVFAFGIFCAAFPSTFSVIFWVIIPESPYFLLAKGKHEQAETSLMKLRSQTNDAIQKELALIEEEVDKAADGTFVDIFKSKALIKALTISLSLIILQQFTGINVVFIYTQSIFEATGSDIPAAISSIIIGAVQLCATFVTPALVSSMERKLLLVISATSMFIAQTYLGLYFYLLNNTRIDVGSISWLPLLSLTIFVISFNVGFGSIPFALLGEIFPSNVQSGAFSATSYVCCILSFLTAKFFNSAMKAIGMSALFWMFAGVCVVADIFVIIFIPETKGKSLRQIQEFLES